MAAFDVDIAVAVNDNDNDDDNSSFAPCPPSLAAALLSTSFHTASSNVMPASLHHHCFAAILASLAMNCPCCIAIASPLLAARGKKIRETKNN